MSKFWLPRNIMEGEQGLIPQTVKDEKTGREMILFLPTPDMTESRAHHEDLIEDSKEKAIEQMRAKGPKVISKQETGKLLKEFREYLERNKTRSTPHRFIHGARFDGK